MTLASRTVNFTIKNITRVLCRIYDSPLAQIPYRGPLILVVNHINFLDIPVLYTHLQPRPVTGFPPPSCIAHTWSAPTMTTLSANRTVTSRSAVTDRTPGRSASPDMSPTGASTTRPFNKKV